MEKKLNNDIYWLTKEADPKILEKNGNIIRDMEFAMAGDKRFSYIYYHSGSDLIDNMIGSDYTYDGYISTIFATIPTVGLQFMDVHNFKVNDFGLFHINRESILSFDETKNQNKEIIDLSKCKDNLRFMRNAAGLVGRGISNAIDRKKAFPMIVKNGSIFNLRYIDKNELENTLQIFVENEHSSLVRIFLNTYYKNVLPEEAKKPVSNTLCYVATACYGDLYANEVILLRRFRDDYLNNTIIGKLFIKCYYLSSTFLYKPLLKSPKISGKIKYILDYLVAKINKKYYSK